MTNRKRIEIALKKAGYKIKVLEFIRHTEYIYGDSCDASYWNAETECGEIFTSDNGDTVSEGAELMIADIFNNMVVAQR